MSIHAIEVVPTVFLKKLCVGTFVVLYAGPNQYSLFYAFLLNLENSLC